MSAYMGTVGHFYRRVSTFAIASEASWTKSSSKLKILRICFNAKWLKASSSTRRTFASLDYIIGLEKLSFFEPDYALSLKSTDARRETDYDSSFLSSALMSRYVSLWSA